ncbi:MAG: HIT domain-containing protein [Phycisphaerae bacterium]|nr:HIT domain-containing protein [Phycisphaerae bacterium]
MPEANENLWAPWRMEYIRSLSDEAGGGCFLCQYWSHPESDTANHVLWRTDRAMVLFNRFPYSNGHLLIATGPHKPALDDLDDAEKLELIQLVADAQAALSRAISPHGFNVGINFGRCAGAGLPDHLHLHLVPRWNGDTNFMSVVGDARVILQSIDTLYADLRRISAEAGLPRTRRGSTTR